MIEVHTNLWVGTEADYYAIAAQCDGWFVVHACKEPFHRQTLGYSGRGAPKNHPEYLLARRGHRLILNLVDVDSPAYVAKKMIDVAIDFIGEGLKAGRKVLVHCNQGESRGPTIGFLYLAATTDSFPADSFDEAVAAYRTLYPRYNPAAGMVGFARVHYVGYRARPAAV